MNSGFKSIENIKKYLAEGLECGELTAKTYQKFGRITARVGKLGEKIVTVMANGLKETENTVTADENGNLGWVVTALTGEQYIVTDKVFKSKYEKVEGTENEFKPVWNPITAAQIKESISFTATWGELQNLAANGYLVFNKDFSDIYGVQKDEFLKTYEEVQP